LVRNRTAIMKFQDSYKFRNRFAGKMIAYGGLFIIFTSF